MRSGVDVGVDWKAAPGAAVAVAPEMRRLQHLYSPEQIAFVLQRERARSDRQHSEFSLVMVRSESSDIRLETALQSLAKIILAHARATDEVGYHDKSSVCIVLPDTNGDGAWKYAQRVCDTAKRQGLMPVCVVYTYPSAWFTKSRNGEKDSNNHNGHSGGNGHGGGKSGASQNGHAQAANLSNSNRRRGMMPVTVDSNGVQLPPSEIPVQGLEALLARPAPLWKRSLDMLGAGCALILFAPLMAIIAIAIKISSPGPVMFKQKRAGLGGRPFEIYKFRSMTTDAEARKKDLMAMNEQDGPAFKIKSDPRITRIGKLIRCTSLDELPQLWNVLRGEMSLVGPRPLPMDEAGAALQWQHRRLEVTPGLTCIWQIKGRSRVTFDEWVRMDINYIRRRNIKHDLSIILQTIPAVLLRRGAR